MRSIVEKRTPKKKGLRLLLFTIAVDGERGFFSLMIESPVTQSDSLSAPQRPSA